MGAPARTLIGRVADEGSRRGEGASVAEFLTAESWKSASHGPLYVRLQRRIEEGLESGLLGPDDPLPSEREMAELTGFSRVTVRKAMRDLVARGSVVQRQGSGSFIAAPAPRVEQTLTRLTSFTEDMESRGLVPSSSWLQVGVVKPSPDELVALALSSNDRVSRVARLRLADGQPMGIERASLPTDLLPDPEQVENSLYDILEESGNRPVRALQKISAIKLNARDAELLQVETDAAGLHIERISYLAGGRAAEFTRSIFRGDAYEFVTELSVTRKQA